MGAASASALLLAAKVAKSVPKPAAAAPPSPEPQPAQEEPKEGGTNKPPSTSPSKAAGAKGAKAKGKKATASETAHSLGDGTTAEPLKVDEPVALSHEPTPPKAAAGKSPTKAKAKA